MKKITFLLEYGCIPIWVDNEEGELICVGLPEDLKDNSQLENLLKEIATEYDALFINNSKEFSYRGFSSDEEEQNFDQKVHKAIGILMKEAKGKYHVEVAGFYAKDYL